jgi:monomeric isocitrate dehydrogenase
MLQWLMHLPWWLWFLVGYSLSTIMMNWLFTAELKTRDRDLFKAGMQLREFRDALRLEQFKCDQLLKELRELRTLHLNSTVIVGLDPQKE